MDPTRAWLWRGYLPRAGITLFSALWKAGKTTLLNHLLKALERDQQFCGREVRASRALYVTEEHESLWAQRRDQVGLKDHLEFLIRPFVVKPDMKQWLAFLCYLQKVCAERAYDLIVFDTISNLWPVRDENDNAKVQECLMPLRAVTKDACLKLVHHFRKGDGTEATSSRGAGALPGFCDTIMELRRYDASNRKDRRRVLTAYGRYPETEEVAEVVVELGEDGYEAMGDRADVSFRALADQIEELLPCTAPGITYDQLMERWPGNPKPTKRRVLDALRNGAERGRWMRTGEGVKGDPYFFWRP
jgi:hypothetical protein